LCRGHIMFLNMPAKNRRIILHATLCICIFAFTGCDKGAIIDDPIHATISGIVVNTIDSTIIVDAWVDIDDSLIPYYTITDSAGAYNIALIGGFAPVDMELYFGKTGFLTWDTEIVIPAGINMIYTIDVYLIPE